MLSDVLMLASLHTNRMKRDDKGCRKTHLCLMCFQGKTQSVRLHLDDHFFHVYYKLLVLQL